MLTPIRVRGRRNKRQKNDTVADTHSRRPLQNGRPMISFDAISSSQSRLSEKRNHRAAVTAVASSLSSQYRTAKIVTRSSTIERLPVELLEKIFLYALDTNFARASPALAAAISSERMYRALILLAFWNDSTTPTTTRTDASHRRARAAIARALRPADYTNPLVDEQRAALQSAILRCRWCTRQRIQAQLPELMRITIEKHWFGAGVTMDPEQQALLQRFLARREVDQTSFHGVVDNTPWRMEITPLVAVDVSCAETGHRSKHPVLGLRDIPDRLLRRGAAGFSEDDVDYLEMLRHQYGFFDDNNNNGPNGTGPREDVFFSRDALHQGIQNALRTRNARALTTLLKIDEFFTRRRLESSPEGHRHHYYALPPEHFRTAVHVAGHDPTFFQLLLRANAESVPPDDPEVTQWAMDLENGEDHSSFGRWLLDFMTRLPSDIDEGRANPRQAAVFFYGEINPQTPMGRRYLEEVLPDTSLDAGLSSWIHEVSYDVSETWTPSV